MIETIKRMVEADRINYQIKFIPKRSDKTKKRKIFVFNPCDSSVANAYKALHTKLNTLYGIDKNAVGYRKGIGTKKVAEKHQKHNWFYKFDFSNFFPSFKLEHVVKKFGKHLTDREISMLTWVSRTGGVPAVEQGNPLSPLVSNIMMQPFDVQFLKNLKATYNCEIAYSRYADDILVSSFVKLNFNKVQKILVKTLRETALGYLSLNKEKSRALRKGGKIIFLGISINTQNSYGAGATYRKQVIGFIKLLQKKMQHKHPRAQIWIPALKLFDMYHRAVYLNSISENKIDLGAFKMLMKEKKFRNLLSGKRDLRTIRGNYSWTGQR